MKLIVCSIGVLVVSGAISLAIAPVSSLAQSADTINRLSLPGYLSIANAKEWLNANDCWNASDDQMRSALQAILTPTQLMQLESALERNIDISQSTLTALNLSPVQQAEVMQILLSGQPSSPDVLMPEQVEQVRRTLPFHF